MENRCQSGYPHSPGTGISFVKSVRGRLTIAFAIIGLVPAVITGAVYYADAPSSLIPGLLPLIASISTAVIIAISFWLSRYFAEPLTALATTAEAIIRTDLAALITTASAIANGDLTKPLEIETRNIDYKSSDEIGQLADSLNRLTASIHDISALFSKIVTEWTELISEVISVSSNLTITSEQLSGAVRHIEQGLQQSRQNTDAMFNNPDNTADGTDKIRDAVNTAPRSMTDIYKRCSEISRIAASIDGLSAQTSLIALNAVIEAARAGEQGHGFAAVADEVRRLIERSSWATSKVLGLLSSIQDAFEKNDLPTEEGKHELNNGSKQAGLVSEALNDILKNMYEDIVQMDKTSSARTDANSLSDDVDKMTNSVSGADQENTAAPMAISDPTEKISTHMTRMVTSVQLLARMAQDLNRSVSVFKASTMRGETRNNCV